MAQNLFSNSIFMAKNLSCYTEQHTHTHKGVIFACRRISEVCMINSQWSSPSISYKIEIYLKKMCIKNERGYSFLEVG
jgi:hypothetical protein